MSVINNVLKDLENKSSAFTPLDMRVVETQQSAYKNPRNMIALTLLVLSVMAVLLISQFDFFSDSKKAVAEMLGIEVTQPAEAVKAVEELNTVVEEPKSVAEVENISPVPDSQPEQNEIAEIQGMQINETKDFLELSLQLSRQSQSYLKAHNNNRYKFLISQSHNRIDAPELENNPWLQYLDFSQTDSGVEILFETVNGVLVETDHRLADDKYNWVIRLKKSIQQVVENPVQPLTVENNDSATVDTVDKAAKNVSVNAPVQAEKQVQEKVVKLEIRPARSTRSAQTVLSSAIDAMKQKNWPESEKLLIQLQGSEVDQAARINLIKMYVLSGQQQKSLRLIGDSLRLYPQNMELNIIHAQQLFRDKQYRAVVDQYQNRLDNLTIMSLIAASLQRMDQHDRAIQVYQKALKIDPRQPKNWISMGISLEHEQSFSAAKDAYYMAIRSGQLNPRLQNFTEQRIKKLSNL